MKVEELRKKLEGHHPKMRVVLDSSVGGFEDVENIEQVNIIADINTSDIFSGTHQESESEEAKETALLIA